MDKDDIANGLKYHPKILEAWANGKQLQYIGRDCGEWKDLIVNPAFYQLEKYRIKPETRTISGEVPMHVTELVRGRSYFIIRPQTPRGYTSSMMLETDPSNWNANALKNKFVYENEAACIEVLKLWRGE